MIKLSNLADYAVVLMSTIAARPDDIHTAGGLNADTRVPLPTVSKILGKMAKANLLASHRGAGGGFSLNSKNEISIADIIEAVDGPVQLTNCLGEEETNCDYVPVCSTRGKWDKINRAVYEALNNVSLSEMVSQSYDFFPEAGNEPTINKEG
ncbi:MAG: SUF system Fe-S cluster assembly regulator [Emcibacteraceae bacterium]|nr:SUF system Fe-S cluster assembly regulator [Emcibacteraceae bacterium]